METREFAVEVTLKLYVNATDKEAAKDVVYEALLGLNDAMAEHFVAEWSEPSIEEE